MIPRRETEVLEEKPSATVLTTNHITNWPGIEAGNLWWEAGD
jgi:hypothetical protein